MILGVAGDEGIGPAALMLIPVLLIGAVYLVIKKTAQIKVQEKTREDSPFVAKRPTAGCEYGEINHNYSHDLSRKIAQLDSFLKNGIIEKAEYNVLLAKYKKIYEEQQK